MKFSLPRRITPLHTDLLNLVPPRFLLALLPESIGMSGGSICLTAPLIHTNGSLAPMWLTLAAMGIVSDVGRWHAEQRSITALLHRFATLPLRILLTGCITVICTAALPNLNERAWLLFSAYAWPLWLMAVCLMALAAFFRFVLTRSVYFREDS